MGRIGAVMLFVAIAGLFTTATILFHKPVTASPGEAAELATSAQRWCALPKAARQAHVLRYRMVSRRADAPTVFEHARAFAALPAAEQGELRLLSGVLQDVLGQQPAPRQRALLALHQRARAEEVYRILQREQPERLAKLRARFTDRP